jgi:hypothetical protein
MIEIWQRRNKIKWFAIWNGRRNVSYALDFYPDEVEVCVADMRKRRTTFSGPYNTREEAREVAVRNLIAVREKILQARRERRRKTTPS